MRRNSARLLATLTLVAAVAALALAAQTTAPASLVTIAATAALGIALAAVGVTSAPTARAIHVGHRAARDRESLASQTAPSHPNTAGRPRPRAPGRPLPAA